MPSALDELRAIAPPPSQPPPVVDWAGAERELGVTLPPDYTELIDAYGAGSFDDFLSVFAPGHPNRYLDLLRQAKTQAEVLRELGEPVPYVPLLAWAQTGNGDTLFWHMNPGDDPRRWAVVGTEARGPDWYRHDGGAAQFLAAVLSGRERVELFPDDFPSAAPRFSRA